MLNSIEMQCISLEMLALKLIHSYFLLHQQALVEKMITVMDINLTDELRLCNFFVLPSTACPLAFLTNICSNIVTLDTL